MIRRPYLSALAPLMNEFVLSRKAADTWSVTYSDNLHNFDKYCFDNFPKQSELVEGMLAWCNPRDSENGNSCRVRTTCVWNFVEYLRELGKTTIRSKRQKYVKDLSFAPHLFTDEELDQFFVECDRKCLAKCLRIKTLSARLSALEIPIFFRLLRSSGLRTCEARWLNISDIDFTSGVVSVLKSKGGGQHRIVLHQSMLELRNRYIESLSRLMPESALLFPDAKGHPHDPRWESYNFRDIWSHVSCEPARAYDFRHLYATQNIEAMEGIGCEMNGELMFLARSMGHSSPAMTCAYFHYIPVLHDKRDVAKTLSEIFFKINRAMGKTKKRDAALQESLRLSALVHKWTCSYLPSVGAQSPHTVRTYRSSLGMFSKFLSQYKGLTPFNLNADCFSANVMNEWVVWMKTSAGASSSTCNNRMAAIKSLLLFMGGEDMGLAYLYDATKKHVKPIHEPQREVNSISNTAIKALFQEPDLNSRVGRRDYTFLLLTYGTGMRLDEVLSLKVKDLTMVKGKGAVHVIGKGNKLRTIPLLDTLVDNLCLYMNDFHGRTPKANDLVFYSPCHGMRAKLTQPAMSKRLKLYAERAHFNCSEVPLDMHVHVLRHSRATHWREEGLNLVEIMELLGHSSYQSTLIYQTVTDQQKREAIEKMADEEVNNLPKKWLLPENTSLAEAFGIYTK